MANEYRVDELAARAGVSVDTVRFYQSRRLLPPPRRDGRVARYSAEHLERLHRIRALQSKGFSLAAIRRLLDGELDAADEALVGALAASRFEGTDSDEEFVALDELANRSGVPLPLLQAVVREGLLIPRVHDGEPRFTADDVEVVRAGLRLLEFGLPLPEVLALARDHHAAMRAVAESAVALFDEHVRHPLREAGADGADAAARLVEAFEALLPATTTLVSHHFRRMLLAVAVEHIEDVGDESELGAVHASAQRRIEAVR